MHFYEESSLKTLKSKKLRRPQGYGVRNSLLRPLPSKSWGTQPFAKNWVHIKKNRPKEGYLMPDFRTKWIPSKMYLIYLFGSVRNVQKFQRAENVKL